MLHVMDIMGPVVTYVEVTFVKYHTFLFIAILPMLICDMHHYAHLIWVIVLTLYIILWLWGVIFRKVNHWKYCSKREGVPAYSELLIFPPCHIDMLNVLLDISMELWNKFTYLHLVGNKINNVIKQHKNIYMNINLC